MSAQATILQAFRAALIAALGIPGERVIPAHDRGPRPPLPYLTVHVLTPGRPVGTDEEVYGLDEDEAPQVQTVGQREAAVSVQGFGRLTVDWLETFALSLTRSAVAAVWAEHGLAVDADGEPRDLAALLDTSFEARWVQEFRVQYQVAGPAETLVELVEHSLELTLERYPDDPDPLVVTDEELT